MNPSLDYYAILDIRPDAGQAEIKRAFRRKAREYHPDVNPSPDAERRFKQVNEAYQVLSDERSRVDYDLQRETRQSRARQTYQTAQQSWPPPPGSGFYDRVAEKPRQTPRRSTSRRRPTFLERLAGSLSMTVAVVCLMGAIYNSLLLRRESLQDSRLFGSPSTSVPPVVLAGPTPTEDSRVIYEPSALLDQALRPGVEPLLVYGPAYGRITRGEEGLARLETGLQIEDFAVLVTFSPPDGIAAGAMEFGILFREADDEHSYWLSLDPVGGVVRLIETAGAETLTVASDRLLDPAGAEWVELLLVVQGQSGELYVNGSPALDFELSQAARPGGIALTLGGPDEWAGLAVGFHSFTVLELAR